MTKVKICGITNLEDAQLSAKFGADALGFNFYPKSPRNILPEVARKIIDQLPENILNVGVFVNENLERIVEIAKIANLNAIQLHGEETPSFAKELKEKTKLEIIKAFRVSPEFKPEDVLQYEVDAILLDSYSPKEYGGTGKTFNWEYEQNVIINKVKEFHSKLYLAGGISEENLSSAIILRKPYYVDSCSLLESKKGKKDEVKLINFLSHYKFVLNKTYLYDDILSIIRSFRGSSINFPKRSISHLCSFLFGYYAASDKDSDFISDKNILRQFDKWLKLTRSSYTQGLYSYESYFLDMCNGDEQQAFDLFYAKLEEFLLEIDFRNE